MYFLSMSFSAPSLVDALERLRLLLAGLGPGGGVRVLLLDSGGHAVRPQGAVVVGVEVACKEEKEEFKTVGSRSCLGTTEPRKYRRTYVLVRLTYSTMCVCKPLRMP